MLSIIWCLWYLKAPQLPFKVAQIPSNGDPTALKLHWEVLVIALVQEFVVEASILPDPVFNIMVPYSFFSLRYHIPQRVLYTMIGVLYHREA